MKGGVKYISRSNYSNIYNTSYVPSIDTLIGSQVGSFAYRQQVISFYNSYQLNFKGWGIKAGVRFDHTYMDYDVSNNEYDVKNQSYSNLIPSINLLYSLKKHGNLTLGYTQRLQRPGIYQLNPFVNIVDPRTIFSGNPDLKTVVNHNVELNYSYFNKSSIYFSLYYSFAENTIQYISSNIDTITRSTYANLGQNKNLGFTGSFNIPVTKSLNLSTNAKFIYVNLRGGLANQFFENNGVQGSAYLYLTQNFKNDFRLSLSGGYFSPTILLQGKSNYYYYNAINLNKFFFKKKLVVSGSVTNPFMEYRTIRTTLAATNFNQLTVTQRQTRNFTIGFSYNFGELKTPVKRSKRSINNDDIKNSVSDK